MASLMHTSGLRAAAALINGSATYRVAILLALLAGFAGVAGCGRSDRNAGKVNPDVVAGVYTSTQFIEPGANDAGVNVHATGGYINLTITRDHKVDGRLVIPAGIGSNDDGADRVFQGTWKPKGAGITIKGTGTLIDDQEWICGTGFLEMSRAGRGPLQIKLQKMHDITTE